MLSDVLFDVECVAAGSTSGVEAGFSKGLFVFGERQAHASEELENHYLKLAQDYKHRDPEVVARLAQHIWKETYGIVRASGSDNRKSRIDAGTKRTHVDNGITDASFNRCLNKCRRVGVDTIPEVETIINNFTISSWTPDHAEEVNFAKGKESLKRVRATDEGVLFDGEVDSALRISVEEHNNKMLDSERVRANKLAKQEVQMDGGKLPTARDLQGLRCYTMSPSWKNLCTSNGFFMVHTDRVSDAEVFITNTPTTFTAQLWSWVV